MIIRGVKLVVHEDAQGLFFDSQVVDLDVESLSIPANWGDGMGTVEFHRRHVLFHPPNGKTTRRTVREFIATMSRHLE